MRRAGRLLSVTGLLVAGCMVAACTAPAPRPTPTPQVRTPTRSAGCGHPSPAAPGTDHELRVPVDPALADGQSRRSAVIHVPAGYHPDRAAPVVVEFHGAGPNATAAGYEAVSPLRRVSDADGFLDVFPQGLRFPNGNLGWNAYGPVIVKTAELPFVDALLDAVAADWCVDQSRVYASGVSNGGNMVDYLGCRDAGRFAALAPVVAPTFGQDDGACRPSRPMPILDVHATDDPSVPYGGHASTGGGDFAEPSVPDWLAGWAALDGCPPPGPPQDVGDGTQRRLWDRCRGGAEVVAYATSAGHAWPAMLAGHPAAETVWSFFFAHGR